MILYKAFHWFKMMSSSISLVQNDVIKYFIGSFKKLSEGKSRKNQDGRQYSKQPMKLLMMTLSTNEIVDDDIINQ